MMGPSKSGKTTLACYLFGKPNTAVVSYDPDGLRSVRPIDNVFIIGEASGKPHDDFINSLPHLQKLKGKVTTIVVDDLMHAGMTYLENAKPSPNKLKMYGEAIGQLREVVNKLKYDFTWANVIFTATDMYVADKEDEDAPVMTYPNVIGRYTFAQEMPARCDHVFFVLPPKQIKTIRPGTNGKIMDVNCERKILTTADGIRLAGNRMNTIDEHILELKEEVTIGEGLNNIEQLRAKLLGEST
jgi:hypothetical protein